MGDHGRVDGYAVHASIRGCDACLAGTVERVDGRSVHPTPEQEPTGTGAKLTNRHHPAGVAAGAGRSAPALFAPALEEADHVPGRIGRLQAHVEAP